MDSVTSKAPTRTEGRKPYIFRSPRGASPSGLKGRKPCRNFCKESARNLHVIYDTLPVCQNCKSESRCKYGDKCHLRHTEAGGKPSKKSKKSGEKGSVALLKETIQVGCVSHDSPHSCGKRKLIGVNLHNQVLESHDASSKNSETKGPSPGIIQKCEPQERVLWASKFEERTKNEILRQERCARKAAWNLAKGVYNLKRESQDTFYYPAEAWLMPAPSSTNPEERHFVIDSGASVHMLSKKDLSSGQLETLK